MPSAKVLLALGFTLAATTSAAPLSDLTPTIHPLFEVLSRVPASTATGVANVTAGKIPIHKHTPECEHNYSANHNSTIDHAHNSTTEVKGQDSEGKGHHAASMGNSSPYPEFNASSYTAPHRVVEAHNHTGSNCSQYSQHNTTATDAASDKISNPNVIDGSADSSHTDTGYRCAYPSHSNRTASAGHSYDKKSIVPEVVPEGEVRVCLEADCKKESRVVRAQLDGADRSAGIKIKNGKRTVWGPDRESSYDDMAIQMSGARIAGGV